MNELLRYVCATLIAAGGFITIFSAFRLNKTIKRTAELPGKLLTMVNRYKNISRVMLGFFIIGFIVGFIDVMWRAVDPMFYFVGIVFFVAGVFCYLLIAYLGHLVEALCNYNDDLQAEVNAKVKESEHQGRLLWTVNESASILLASDLKGFDKALWRCLGMLAECMDADRARIWKNHEVDGALYCTQMLEWSEGAPPQQDTAFTKDISFDKVIPGWEETLSGGNSINGLVSGLSPAENAQLAPQGIVSILVVPIFLQGEFWGFMGFDDCRNERVFSDGEEGILRSASMLIATCMLRINTTQELIIAKEAADGSARSKSDFLSNMSHEIRTPINAITGMTAIARRSDDMGRIKDCLSKIDAASRQLLGLINDILDMSKIDAGKMEIVNEPFDLHGALQNVKSIIGVRAEEKNVNFDLQIDEGLAKVIVSDEMRLSQILLNLLSNAIKFTPEDGTVVLAASTAALDGDTCTLQFDVTDTGIGISDEQKSRLFQAFEQADRKTSQRYGGTGLGLAISKRIANMMDGDIEVDSKEGKGSRFSVRVKARLGSEDLLKAAQEKRDEPSDDLMEGRTILLAEDIEINREIVTTLLEEKGAKVISAVNGAEAVDMFKSQPAEYDLILMDVFMPVMDGLEATHQIRALPEAYAKEIPILAMTANAFEEDVKQCLDAGMNGHIAKPIDVDQLFDTLARHLQR